MKTTEKPSLLQTAAGQYRVRMKELKRKKFKLKARIYLTILLPAFLIVLFAKVLKAYLEIKVRSLFSKPDMAVKKETKEKNTEPVSAVITPGFKKD